MGSYFTGWYWPASYFTGWYWPGAGGVEPVEPIEPARPSWRHATAARVGPDPHAATATPY